MCMGRAWSGTSAPGAIGSVGLPGSHFAGSERPPADDR
jgi:hypothetical protein